MVLWKNSLVNIFFTAIIAMATPEEEPGYGSEWLYFVADNGSTYVMNFSSLPEDSRGLVLGDVYFHLYTRCNNATPETLTIPENKDPIQSKYFNPENSIKVLTHGWMSSDTTEWLQSIKDTYLETYDYNVITVDWSEIADNPVYPWPALSTRYVGKRVAKLLAALIRTYDVDGDHMHLIGHSLGAQIMGYAGMFSEQRVYRITGLDPARPMFELPPMGDQCRLDKSDAQFVDIIHTCSGVYGYKYSHGHADFYPNGGKPPQPGCEETRQKLDGCSHGRSCLFFGESITSTGFVAYPCDSYNQFENHECTSNSTLMGDRVSVASRGDYYLHTKNHSKYAVGEE